MWSILKWGALALLLVAGAAALFTRKEFRAEAQIAAPPEKIWAALMDTPAYPDWNPVFVKVEGEYAEGAQVLNTVRFPDGSGVEMAATVRTLIPNRELRQSGGTPGVLTFDHRWLLEPADGGTKVVQHEIDRGIGLWFWNSSWVEPAYQRTTDALKARVEQLGQ